MNNFLDALREETGTLHRQLEALPLPSTLTADTITLADYTNYLGCLQPLIQDLEENLFPILTEVLPDINSRRKLAWISDDLNILTYQQPLLPLSRQLTGNIEPVQPAFAMGILYVFEGSTLGGRIIVKNINKKLQLSPGHGSRYFTGYGAKTGENWKSFLTALEYFARAEQNPELIIAGAAFAFKVLIQQFTPQPVRL